MHVSMGATSLAGPTKKETMPEPDVEMGKRKVNMRLHPRSAAGF